MMRSRVAVGVVCGFLAAGIAQGQVQKGLEYSITPFLWAMSLNGSVEMGSVGGDVDAGFSDILDAAEMVVPIHFEAKGAVWTLIAEINYASLSQDLFDKGSASGELGIDMLIAELLSGYRFANFTELIFGVRYVSLDNSLTFRLPGPISNRKFDANQEWVDPVIGLRYSGPLGRKWSFGIRGDVGGFGLGSDLTWNLRANFGLSVSEVTTLMFGWHTTDFDYDNNSFVYDMTHSGPELGIRFKL